METETQFTLIDRVAWGGGKVPSAFGMRDLRLHLHVIGKTGSGKTTLLRNLLSNLIEAGHGCGVIDPHGDLAEEMLDLVPPQRMRDVLYFQPGDVEHPVSFNPLASKKPPHLVAADLVSAFKAIWIDSWGPRMEYILFNTLAALAECQNVTLLSATRMYVDEQYRAWVVRQVRDPVVRRFWLEEFESYDSRFRREAVAPIQNKLGQFFGHAPIRNILGQVRSRVDVAHIMDQGGIVIVNLAKGEIGEEGAHLLGALLINEFHSAALGRVGTPETERRDFTLIVDEFQNFMSETAVSLLAEARKYRLSLVLSHQYLGQLRERIRDSVLGNVGTTISFRVGAEDAELLSRSYGDHFSPSQFVDLDPFELFVRPTPRIGFPFRGFSHPPNGTHYGRGPAIREESRRRFTQSRSKVEERLRRWLNGPSSV